MTEALQKAVPPWLAAALALVSSIVTGVYSAGYQSAKLETAERDIATLQRQVSGLYAHVRRLQNWPSRSSEPSMKTDAQ